MNLPCSNYAADTTYEQVEYRLQIIASKFERNQKIRIVIYSDFVLLMEI